MSNEVANIQAAWGIKPAPTPAVAVVSTATPAAPAKPPHPDDEILRIMVDGHEPMTEGLRRQYDAFEQWAYGDGAQFSADCGAAHYRQKSDLRRRIVKAYLDGQSEPVICRTVGVTVENEELFPSPDFVRLVLEAHRERRFHR